MSSDKFWDLVGRSVITQGLVTTVLVLTTCYLWVTGREVPQGLLGFDGLVMGFFFGAKVQHIVHKNSR